VVANQTECQCNPGYVLTPAYTCQLQQQSTQAQTQPQTHAATSSTNSPSSSGSAFGTSTIYGGATNIASGTAGSKPVTSCATNAYYSNGTCRSQAVITVLQKILVQNAVYLSIQALNLPDTITSKGCPYCPYLINATISGHPANLTTIVNYISYEYNQWIIAMAYNTTPLFTATLLLSFNTTYASYFTTKEMQTVVSTLINPYDSSQIKFYNLTVSSPSLTTNDAYQLNSILDPSPAQTTQPQPPPSTSPVPAGVLQILGSVQA
jgi:hypothetical protein